MSVCCEPDYILNLLRLQYLRYVRDPLGPTTITFPETFSPYVLHSDLQDSSVWPELLSVKPAKPVAPGPSTSGHQGANLKHRETIIGQSNGTSGLGMRVNARRSSWSARNRAKRPNAPPAIDSSPEKNKSRALPDSEVDDSDDFQDAPDRLETRRLSATSTASRHSIPAKVKPPTLMIQSPGVTPHASPTGPDIRAPPRPLTFETDSAGSPASLVTMRPSAVDLNVVETVPSASASLDRRPRPVTILDTPDYGHDKELSDALRWESDGPQFKDATSPSARSPATSPTAVLGHAQYASEDSGLLPQLQDEYTPISQSESLNSDKATLRRKRMGSDASSLAPTNGMAASNEYRAKTEDDYDFASVLDTSSLAALKNRRLRPKASEIDLQSLAQINSAMRKAQSRPASPQKSVHVEPTTTAFTGRRERRRVNIGKMGLPFLQQQTQAVPDTSPSSSLTRPRAITGPAQSLSRRNSLESKRRQGSLDSARPHIQAEHIVCPPKQDVFAPKKVSIKPQARSSILTSMLLQQPSNDASNNPFMSDYCALVLRSPGQGLALRIFFPHAVTSKGVGKIDMKVRKDVTVEEVIGCSLFCYWEDDVQPALLSDTEKQDWDQESYTGRLDPAAWNLRIVEDDDGGEVDDDFPALDRTLPISSFAFGAFALVEASMSQLRQNKVVQAQIQRRPSRIIPRPKLLQPSSQNSLTTSNSNRNLVEVDTDFLSTFAQSPLDRPGNLSTSYSAQGGKEVYLRIRIPMPGLEAVVSTVKVTELTYLADVIETICRKRREHLKDPKAWVLMLGDKDIIAPTDRTVDSLQGNHNLRLVRKSDVAGLTQLSSKQAQNVNPSASIFKRLSEPAQPKYISASDVTRIYKQFTVHRKHAMSLGRHERLLILDGEYIYIQHPAPESGRTATYHISNVAECKPSKRIAGSFKLLVYIGQDLKRYDFEAANIRQLPEILATIASQKQQYKSSRA